MESDALILLEQLVNIDSGTGDLEGMKKIAGIIEEKTRNMNGIFETLVAGDGSQHYLFRRGQGKKILLIAHLDTVFSKGTVYNRPFSMEGDVARGPGVSDCKSGVVTILEALRNLNLGRWPNYEIYSFFNTDEEISSPGSREFIRKLAQDAEMVLVVEPSEGENLTVARKGIGRFLLQVYGKSAHSGSNYQDGCNAILEIAHQIIAIQNLTDLTEEITLNPGVVSGGTRPNIVPDYAELDIDLRVKSPGQVEKIITALTTIASRNTIPGTYSKIKGEMTRPPLVATPENLKLYEKFKKIGLSLGIDLGLLESGGGSDANLVAELGVPTIDGLGPVGGGHHSEAEYMSVPGLTQRIQLLTHFLKEL